MLRDKTHSQDRSSQNECSQNEYSRNESSQDRLVKKCSYASAYKLPILKTIAKVLTPFVLCALAQTSPASAQVKTKTYLFLVQIKNLSDYRTDRWTFGEGVWVLHDQEHPLFKHGEPLYQNGMHSLLRQSEGKGVVKKLATHQGIVAGATFAKKKIKAGEKISFAISVSPGQRFSFVLNLHETNDKFFAPMGDGIKLFDFFSKPISGGFTQHIYLWDGGSSHDEDPELKTSEKTYMPDPNNKVRMVLTGEKKAVDGFSYPHVEHALRLSIKSF